MIEKQAKESAYRGKPKEGTNHLWGNFLDGPEIFRYFSYEIVNQAVQILKGAVVRLLASGTAPSQRPCSSPDFSYLP
jgi:hypothetical protein